MVISIATAFETWPTASLFQEHKKHQQCIELKFPMGQAFVYGVANRVIPGMPPLPLKRVPNHLPDLLSKCLRSVNGFPMMKIFFATDLFLQRGS